MKYSQIKNRTNITYDNNRTFLRLIDTLPTQGTGWTCDIITSKGNRINDDGDLMPAEKLELWRRNPVDCIKELFGNPAFRNVMRYAPEHHFADKEGKNRIYDEMWTAVE